MFLNVNIDENIYSVPYTKNEIDEFITIHNNKIENVIQGIFN